MAGKEHIPYWNDCESPGVFDCSRGLKHRILSGLLGKSATLQGSMLRQQELCVPRFRALGYTLNIPRPYKLSAHKTRRGYAGAFW